jgi:hypothetical protein
MSAIKLSTPSSGSISLSPTNTASNLTITVPATTATMAIDGPAFSSFMSTSPSWSNSVFTKVPLNTEEFDTANCFDNATNFRFTPNVAGYYQINGCISFGNTAATSAGITSIYKNGAEFKRGNYISLNAGNFTQAIVSVLVYMNGSTDYLELYGIQISGGNLSINGGSSATYLQASMVRGA